jgi:L,D-transpeptidase YcbB
MVRRSLPGVALILIVLLTPFAGAQTPARIESLLKAGTLEGMRWPDFRAYQESVREFYAPSGYAAAWVQGTTPSPQALSMIQLFEEAWKKGLDPEDYDGGRWQARREALARADADVAAFDVALTVCAMRYVSDLRIGRVNPRHVGFDLTVEQKK